MSRVNNLACVRVIIKFFIFPKIFRLLFDIYYRIPGINIIIIIIIIIISRKQF